MGAPPTDADGYVTPHDDREAIPDGSYVIRRIQSQWLNLRPGGHRGLSSGAFSHSSSDRDRYQGMSVDMLDRLNEDGLDPASRLTTDQEAAVVIRAGDLRGLGVQIGPDPTPSNDKYHASVWGVKSSHRRKIKALSKWLIKPDDVQ